MFTKSYLEYLTQSMSALILEVSNDFDETLINFHMGHDAICDRKSVKTSEMLKVGICQYMIKNCHILMILPSKSLILVALGHNF